MLGGEIAAVMRYEGSPMEDQVPAQWRDKIMHITLSVAGMDLMGSEMSADNFVTPRGYHVAIQLDDTGEAERIFAALAEGAQVSMPLAQTFWATRFGMLTDRFGINWMVNCG